jgi:Tfp pilus assembly protein PilO
MIRRTSVLVALIVLIITGAWWMFLISPRNADIDRLNNERDAAAGTEVTLRGQIQRLEEVRDSEVRYLSALGTLEALIPERPELETFIEEVYALANDTGVELQTLAPSLPIQPEPASDLREITVSASIEGEFFEVLGFLFGISDMERLVRVDSMSAASSQTESGATILAVSLELNLFTTADLLPLIDTDVESATTTVPADGNGGDGA